MASDRELIIAAARKKVSTAATDLSSLLNDLKVEIPIGREGDYRRTTIHLLETVIKNLKVCNSDMLITEYRV